MYFRDLARNHVDFANLASFKTSGSKPILEKPKKVALSFSSVPDLIEALVYVDGQVDDILLLSPTIEGDVASRLIENAGIKSVFGDSKINSDYKPLNTLRKIFSQILPSTNSNWLLVTSGTTSEPKIVSHKLTSLARTAIKTQNARDFVWGQLYDSYRFAGLQVLIQAIFSGSSLIAPPHDMDLSEKLNLFVEAGVNALSGTPSLWRKIIMTPEASKLSLRVITLGGEIVDQSVLDALAREYPTAKIKHIYASTEAGTGFSVSDSLSGFPIAYLDTAVKGVEIKIDDGQLLIKNHNVKAHYIGEKTNDFRRDDGYIETGDLVEINGQRVNFLGRASGMINVGGNKIIPERVEGIIDSVEGIVKSRVYAKKSPILGQLVVAEIQADPNYEKSVLELSVRNFLKSNLERYQIPALFTFVDTIKLSANGKVER